MDTKSALVGLGARSQQAASPNGDSPKPLRSGVILTASAVALGLLFFLVRLILLGAPSRFQVQDPSFHFTFCAVTPATNATVFSGNPLLARLNRKLAAHRLHSISSDHMYELPTTGSQPILSIGYKHDYDSLQLNANGYAYPSSIHLLEAVIVQSGGQAFPLGGLRGGGYWPDTREYVNCWTVPIEVTNLAGGELRLTRKEDGKLVAICRLQ